MAEDSDSPNIVHHASSVAWCGALTALIVAPWWAPGYIFGTDTPGQRFFPLPVQLTSPAPLLYLLAVTSRVVPAPALGKLLITGGLVLAALSAFYALPRGRFTERAVASLIYVFNPFVYDRLLYGQVNVLLGYALLPWVLARMYALARRPGARSVALASVSLWLLGVLDLHMLVPAGLVGLILVVAAVFASGREPAGAGRILVAAPATVAVTLVASSYWMVPLITGQGPEGRVVASVNERQLQAFQATSDPGMGLLVNLMGLYGFFGERMGRFASMKLFTPYWQLALVLLLALAAIAVIVSLSRPAALGFPHARAYVVALLFSTIVAAVLALGVADPWVASVVRTLDAVFPPYRGMRDSGKWIALVALGYAQLVPLGVGWLRDQAARVSRRQARDLAVTVVTGLALGLPLYYGNGLLFGAQSQIQPSDYPTGWYLADSTMTADKTPGRALFVPWHHYLALGFVKNANKVVESPAPTFFSIPTIASTDLGLPGVPNPDNSPDQTVIAGLVRGGTAGAWADQLAQRGIKYVVLARESDWATYGYLDAQSGLRRVADFQSVVVYRNDLWHR